MKWRRCSGKETKRRKRRYEALNEALERKNREEREGEERKEGEERREEKRREG